MVWLAFFQATPGIFSALPIYLIVTFMFFRRSRVPKQICLNFLLGFGIIFVVVLAQSIHQNENVTIIAMVSDQSLREVITKGTYSMENGVDWGSFLRTTVISSVTLMLTVVVNRTGQQEKYISYLINFALASVLIVLILANGLGADQFKEIIAPFTSLETGNYLTSDQFGYRISGFFHEPSHSSVFFGTLLATRLALQQTVWGYISSLAILFAFFLMSRSIGILAIFIITLYFLYAPKWASLVAMLGSAMLQVILIIVSGYFPQFGLFRSVYERALSSEVYNATTLDWFLGFDFGEVYSFEPIVGLTLQIGIVGLVGLYFILQRDVRTIGFFVFSFTLMPQLWFYPAWGAVGVFMIALQAKEMSGAVTKDRKRQDRIHVKHAHLGSTLAR